MHTYIRRILRWCWEFFAQPIQQQAWEWSWSLEFYIRLTTPPCTEVSQRKHTCEPLTATKGTAAISTNGKANRKNCRAILEANLPSGWGEQAHTCSIVLLGHPWHDVWGSIFLLGQHWEITHLHCRSQLYILHSFCTDAKGSFAHSMSVKHAQGLSPCK